MLPAGGNPSYYVEDMLGTSRLITTNNGTVCYDADFDPFGGEHPYTNTCPQNYKFEGKERDTETGNDDFGARSYSSRFGRWLSADWSSVPVPVPYANLTNPQTLNLYSMVSDDPESFADLDGHTSAQMYQLATPGAGSAWDPMGAGSMTDDSGLTLEEFNALEAAQAAQAAQTQQQNASQSQSNQTDTQTAATTNTAPPPNLTFYHLLKFSSDFSAGAGDALTGRIIPGVHTSLTEYLRGKADSVVSKNSFTYKAGGFTGSTVGWSLIGAGSATAAAARGGKYGALFGRGGAESGGFFNRGVVRFGWYWNGVKDAIGLRIGPAGTFHLPFWYP